MSHWDEKEERLNIFENTLQICERERYLIQSIVHSRENTCLWKQPLQEIALPDKKYENSCEVVVSQKGMFQEIRQVQELYGDGQVAVLNMSSDMHLGGLVLCGGEGTEEQLCRCTTLYPCLKTDYLNQEFYENLQLCRDWLYEDTCVYIPGVMWLKGEDGACLRMHERFSLDVINCMLPCVRRISLMRNWEGNVERKGMMVQELEEVLCRRIEGSIRAAVDRKISVLVWDATSIVTDGYSLAFVTEAFKKALQKYSYFFRAIHLIDKHDV